jgi:phosphohistidine phosphatase
MVRLLLIRHAKSSWADAGQADRDRPLNARGRRDAPRIGRWLRKRGLAPERGLVSSSVRTRETWEGLCAGLGRAVEARFAEDLYEADPPAILEALRAAPPAATLALVGHNPGIGEAARRLARTEPDDPLFWKYPTAATAVIDFDAADWRGVGWRDGRLVAFVTPKTLD